MSRIPRPILIGALTLIFIVTGCGVIKGSNPPPVWTVSPEDQTVLPTATLPAPVTATGTGPTPEIPITGENVVSLQCQFCVADQTHAMLVFPAFASFDVDSASPITCLTADVVNSQRIVICRGAQSTTFNLKICAETDNCMDFPVALQPCPLLQAGTTPPVVTNTPFAPVFLTPLNTLKAPKTRQPKETAIPINTPTPRAGPASPTSPPVNTPPTAYPLLPIPTLPILPTSTPQSYSNISGSTMLAVARWP